MKKVDTGKVAKIRSAGFFTKGIVYVIIGVLTFMAAFGLGGDVSGRDDVINFLYQLPLGKALGGITAVGLFAYSLWRFYQMLTIPNTSENDKKVKAGFKRVRYFYSGALYGFIAYSFAERLIDQLTGSPSGGGSESNGDRKAALGELLAQDWGKILIWVIAAVVAGQALRQFYLAYRASFMKKIDNYPDIKHEYDFIRKSGRFGYGARGVVFGILAFFLVQVIIQHNADIYDGTEGALQFLLGFSYGPFLLGAVALGLVGYGIFNIMVARHADLTRLS